MKRVFFLLFFLLAISAHAQTFSGTLSIMQGLTDDTTAQFAVIVPKTAKYTVQAVRDGSDEKIQPVWAKLSSVSFSDDAVLKIGFSGLHLNESYKLQVLDSKGKIIDSRKFKSLDINKPNPRIVYASCMADYLQNTDLWQALVNEKPDLVIFAGDNVYADKFDVLKLKRIPADEEHMWGRYVSTRKSLVFFKSSELRPVLATWDDHDTGFDNANKTSPYMKQALAIFKAFYAQEEGLSAHFEKGPGVSSFFRAFGQNFLLLDDRSERDPENAQKKGSMFGKSQEQWVAERIVNAAGPIVMINGSQFFGSLAVESVFYDYPESFFALSYALRQSKQPVIFVSGDIHFSEIAQIEKDFFGFPTVEITSSSMHSVVYPGIDIKISNDRRIMSTTKYNFIAVKTRAMNGRLVGVAESIGKGQTRYFSHGFNVGF